jgi:isoamylase
MTGSKAKLKKPNARAKRSRKKNLGKQPVRPLSDYLAEVCEHSHARSGSPLPFGAYEVQQGVNFAFFSRFATRVRLEFFDNAEDRKPARFIDLNPVHNRTGDVWHIWVKGIQSGQLYGYRVDGPYKPEEGHRFNFNKLLLDPYASAISPLPAWDFQKAQGYDELSQDLPSKVKNTGATPKCIFTHDYFDWRDDQPLKHPWSNMVIYETHVRGLSIHSSSGVSQPGTYRGLIDKIPYFKELGVTAVELMPVHEFNDYELLTINPETGKHLKNYWGYDPVAFFAPKASYSSSGGLGQQKLEFKEMVYALHQVGIEVILDVVFNHTAEGDELGPTLCFRGIDNVIFYMLQDDKRYYKDFTGTGNTINTNHPIVRDHILSALRYWVIEMHIDGFRFDEATILDRDTSGKLIPDTPLLERIAEDPILRNVKLIAEAWDIEGPYHIGHFSKLRWAEWNGAYRDNVRCFWRGDDGMLGLFAQRLCGSADIYEIFGKGPCDSINFVTCHDGFTLNDLVSYRQKHNEANGENNRDGADENFSDNYGVEGATTDILIESFRKRQIKNFLLTLLVSRGVPMLLGGDEFRRTQQGNNNPYCQDNEISWYDWNELKKHQEIYRFTKGMIAFRQAHPVLCKEEFYKDTDIKWFNQQGVLPDWNNPNSKELACLIDENELGSIYMMFNAGNNDFDFVLPALQKNLGWYLVIDTSQETLQDMYAANKELFLEDLKTYHLINHASAILLARRLK